MKFQLKVKMFFVLFTNQILEHIPDDNLAMQELYRVMKKGGSGIIQVPIDYNRKETYEDFSVIKPEEREKAFGQHDHVRCYGIDYIRKLENVDFKVTEDDFVKTFTEKELLEYSLTPTEMIYYCRK